MIMVARGEQGRVWRLDTDTGAFAIKELVIRQLPAATDTGLDPGVVGATLAAVHQVHYAPARPLIGWCTEPLGALRWTQLLDDAMGC
jgi:hypothetical protein